ncbi:hypothetical protein AEQU_1302 [Adlercreutzia equolifaciens DSM 19450]|nr:hypothetical protein AEQU_1302 [Adlercreutzia equolifaciens DSM 19450]
MQIIAHSAQNSSRAVAGGGARRPLIALSPSERGKRNSGRNAHKSVPSPHRCC